MRIMAGQGIGDVVWALFKVQDYARKHGGGPIDFLIGGNGNSKSDRALAYIRRFKFLNSVNLYHIPKTRGQVSCMIRPGRLTTPEGYYRYIPDGPVTPNYPIKLPGVDHVLMPNAALERGIRLENWLPKYEIDWHIHRQFQFTNEERAAATEMRKTAGDYALLYPGPERGNTYMGMNRGAMWTPEHWVELADRLHRERGIKSVFAGAAYDASYYEKYLEPLRCGRDFWINRIGAYEFNTTLAVALQSRFLVGHASGLPIAAHYAGVRVATWWRPYGNSLDPKFHISFDEKMATAWTLPGTGRNFIANIYGRCSPESVTRQLRDW